MYLKLKKNKFESETQPSQGQGDYRRAVFNMSKVQI